MGKEVPAACENCERHTARIAQLIMLLKRVSRLREEHFRRPALRAEILRELKGEW